MVFEIKNILIVVPEIENIPEFRKKFNNHFGLRKDYDLIYVQEMDVNNLPKSVFFKRIQFIMADNRISEATINSYLKHFKLERNRLSKFDESFRNIATVFGVVE